MGFGRRHPLWRVMPFVERLMSQKGVVMCWLRRTHNELRKSPKRGYMAAGDVGKTKGCCVMYLFFLNTLANEGRCVCVRFTYVRAQN